MTKTSDEGGFQQKMRGSPGRTKAKGLSGARDGEAAGDPVGSDVPLAAGEALAAEDPVPAGAAPGRLRGGEEAAAGDHGSRRGDRGTTFAAHAPEFRAWRREQAWPLRTPHLGQEPVFTEFLWSGRRL